MHRSSHQAHNSSWTQVTKSRQGPRASYASHQARDSRLQQQPQLFSQTVAHLPFVEHSINLVTNAYSLDLNKSGPTIHEYQLSITTASGCKDVQPKVLTKNFVSRSIRKLVLEEIVPKLIDIDADPKSSKGVVIIETNLGAIYSSVPLQALNKDSRQTENEEVLFENVSVKTDLLTELTINIGIKFSRSFLLNSTEQSSSFLTSVLHHKLFLTWVRYGAVYYMSHENFRDNHTILENRLDLISKHILGISISGIKRSINEQNFVVINCSHSYITQPFRLIDLLATFLTNQPVENIRLDHSTKQPPSELPRMIEIASVKGDEAWFSSFSSLLLGFKCRATGPVESNIRFILTEESATNLLIMNPETNNFMSVYDYYLSLGINLNYPNLPCLKSQSSRHTFYPFELCTLLAGQKVPIFRLSNTAGHHLAALNKPDPKVSKQSSSKARDEIVRINQLEFSTFGLKISNDPIKTSGSILQKPTLEYRDKRVEPERDYWESSKFYNTVNLISKWCVVTTTHIDQHRTRGFFTLFGQFCTRFGFLIGEPYYLEKSKDEIMTTPDGVELVIDECQKMTDGNLKLVIFVIDSNSTTLNRQIHLSFDEYQGIAAACLRAENILNVRKEKSIFRTLTHKLNTRLGGTNVVYHSHTLERLSLRGEDLMIIGLDVTHPDNELNGVSIVGCAYTYGPDLFKHRSLVWPQTARMEIIGKLDCLMRRLLHEYHTENTGALPRQIIVYRDGVSHEEFEKVRSSEVTKAQKVIVELSNEMRQPKPILSYIIAQKRHTMRFFRIARVKNEDVPTNPPTGTLIDQDVVTQEGREFFLYSNTSPQATARPLHYHVLVNGLGIENLQKLTYFLCFNFGKCSSTLSMPSSLRYAHNAAYDARNRVIASREFSENRFYSSKFYC